LLSDMTRNRISRLVDDLMLECAGLVPGSEERP